MTALQALEFFLNKTPNTLLTLYKAILAVLSPFKLRIRRSPLKRPPEAPASSQRHFKINSHLYYTEKCRLLLKAAQKKRKISRPVFLKIQYSCGFEACRQHHPLQAKINEIT